jgi:hypothetical protein
LSQKKNKSRKMNRKMSKSPTAQKKLQRAIALGISEPKLRGQCSGNVSARARQANPMRAVEAKSFKAVVDRATETKPSAAPPRPETMFWWSPWNVMLRQQAIVAQALSHMMRAQQQFVRMLSS